MVAFDLPIPRRPRNSANENRSAFSCRFIARLNKDCHSPKQTHEARRQEAAPYLLFLFYFAN
jgi:hypothetical protein